MSVVRHPRARSRSPQPQGGSLPTSGTRDLLAPGFAPQGFGDAVGSNNRPVPLIRRRLPVSQAIKTRVMNEQSAFVLEMYLKRLKQKQIKTSFILQPFPQSNRLALR